jgi:pheromone a factor receptor
MSSPTDGSQPFSKWSIFGFTTTPQERIGPGPPYTYPALQVNLFFRVFLGFVSLFVTWVPARLLWRNGEFAGTVLCVSLMIINFFTLVNALIWRDDNVAEWYAGYGWCDLQTYIQFAIHTAFNVSLFEIMRGLTAKVSINRVSSPTAKERRRERIISALVIFTVPVIQVALIYVVIGNRYDISTLVGCNPVYIPDWIFFVFYILPTPIYAIAAAIMSGEL